MTEFTTARVGALDVIITETLGKEGKLIFRIATVSQALREVLSLILLLIQKLGKVNINLTLQMRRLTLRKA